MLRPSLIITIGTLAGLTSQGARADNIDYHALASGSVATTDNQTGAETGSPGRRAALFSDVRPGMLVTYNSRRHIHELLGEVDFLYFLGSPKPSVTFRSGWKAFFLTGPRSDASLQVDASFGQLNALAASNSPAESGTQVVPLGQTDTAQVAASENASWQATKGNRARQRVFSRYTTTDAWQTEVATKAFEVGTAIGFDIRRKQHNLAFELGGSYLYLDKYDPLFRQMGSRRDNQLNPRGVLIWQYDIDRKWSANVDAGLVFVRPITTLLGRTLDDPYSTAETMPRRAAPFPTFGAVVAYTDVWGRAMLNVRRAVTPNLLIAQNTISDGVNLTFAMPLKFLDKDSRKRQPRVVGIGSAGFDRTNLIDPITSQPRGEFAVARLDLAVAWSPRPGHTFGMRYEFAYQNGDTVGEMVVPSFFRNTFYFTFALRWPENIQVRVPRRAHQSVRADQSDLAPIGAEPVVIDPAELLEGGGDGR